MVKVHTFHYLGLLQDYGCFTIEPVLHPYYNKVTQFHHLRIPDSYDAKIVKICNLWTFWPVLQLISPLFKIRQKAQVSLRYMLGMMLQHGKN